jgi:structural maintenance of chromosome 4
MSKNVISGLIGEGVPNMKALEEYRRREADFLKRVKDMDEITEARDNMKKRYDDLRKTRLEEFMAGFSVISSKLKEMYQVRAICLPCILWLIFRR